VAPAWQESINIHARVLLVQLARAWYCLLSSEALTASSPALRLDRSAARIRLTVFVSEVMDVLTAETP